MPTAALSHEVLLELATAARVAVRALPRRARETRCRLETAVRRVVVAAKAPEILFEEPTAPVAFEQLATAVRIARGAGVDWRDVVVLVNGDDER